VITNNCVRSQMRLDGPWGKCVLIPWSDSRLAARAGKESHWAGGGGRLCEVGDAHPTPEMENERISLLGSRTITHTFFSRETAQSQDALAFRWYAYRRLCRSLLWIPHVCLHKRRVTKLWRFFSGVVCSS